MVAVKLKRSSDYEVVITLVYGPLNPSIREIICWELTLVVLRFQGLQLLFGEKLQCDSGD